MKRTRLAGWMLMAMVLFALAGCGGQQATVSEQNESTPVNENETAAGEQTAAEGSAATAGMSAEVAKIYEAAKQEGKVIYWSPDDASWVEAMARAFNEKYPGIEVESFEIQPGPALERMITEQGAGQTNVDVFNFYLTDVPTAMDKDLIAPYDWAGVFGISPSNIAFDNHALITWHLSHPIVYNTNLVKEDEVPKSWEDLLDPKWKGNILLEARGNAFPILSYKWGEEKTIEYLKSLLEQDPVLIKGGTPSTQAIVNGEAAIGIGPYAMRVEDLKAKGAPIEWAKVGPIALITETAGVLKEAPHPNAALLWASFMASPEGLKAREEAMYGGMLVGDHLSKIGQTMEENGIERVVQSEDNLELQKRMEQQVNAILSGL